MADDKPDSKTDPVADDEKAAAEAEGKFWDRLKSTIGEVVAEQLKVTRTDDKGDGKADQGTSRTGARRTTIQTLISDLVYGPPKD